MAEKTHWQSSRFSACDNDTSISLARELAQSLRMGVKPWPISQTSCVSRSVVLWFLCRSRGLEAVVVSGVPLDKTQDMHAWVEVNAEVINDTDDVKARYLPFDKPYLGSASAETIG